MSFEENFLRERVAELKSTHPAAAKLTEDLLTTIAFEKGAIKDHGMAKHMVFTLCQQLANREDRAHKSFTAWLARFVQDGALEPEQAEQFIARAIDLERDQPGEQERESLDA